MRIFGTGFVWIFVVAFFVFMAWPALQQFSGQGMSVGDRFPELSLENQANETASLPDGVVVLNVWATWCAPCRAELPMLAQFQQRWKTRGVSVVLANEEITAKDRVRDFLSRNGIALPSYFLNASEARKLGGIAVVPTTFVIDVEGRLVARYNRLVSGEELDSVMSSLFVEQADLE